MNNIIGCVLAILVIGYWYWLMDGRPNPFKRKAHETSDKWVQLDSMSDHDYNA